MADTGPLHETRFKAAVKVIQSLPKNGSFQPSNEMMLKFYSFYKQATLGPCNISRPAFWDPVGRYKWDAWSGLGDMSKDEAMIAYVEEMKKILESMPVNEKVEELLQVIGPFYEIVEDKKHVRGPGLTSELSTVLTSTPNCKAVNGKAESSDSGAESEDDDEDEEDEKVEVVLKGQEQEEETELPVKKESTAELEISVDDDLDRVLPNGLNNLESTAPFLHTDYQTKSALNGTNNKEDAHENKPNVQSLDIPDENTDKDADQEHLEDNSGMHHLTSDSDSEVFCDSMEQFGQEEAAEVSLSNQLVSSTHFSKVEDGQLMENTSFPGNNIVTLVDSGLESTIEVSIERKGEVKDGGEDGKPSGRGPHKDKVGNDRMENYAPRRGRGSRLQPPGAGAQGWQTGGSGDDGERWGSERGPSSSLNEQIATVLMRLQEDMQSVLQRLHTLEALTATQARALSLQSSDQPVFHSRKKPSWWPFDMSPGTLAFAVLWPFIAQWLVYVYLQRRRRKLN